MNIAIIPARGGSKRIPRKNILPFLGKPLIAYSIDTALKSGCFDKVIVSTDDTEIAEVSRKYGADVPFLRPAHISDDHATTMDVMEHAIEWCESQKMDIQLICCLYATAPLLLPQDLSNGLALLRKEQVDFTFSAATFPFPIQRALRQSENGEVSMFSPENERVRSQDLEEAYHDAGQFYWGTVDAFKQRKSIFALHSRMVVLPRNRVQDIDTLEDWHFAEALFSIARLEEFK